MLELTPRNGFSPSWRFWLDEETGLRLAYEQRDAAGRLLAAGRYLGVERLELLDEPRDLSLAELPERALERLERLTGPEAGLAGFIPVRLERTGLGAENGRLALRLTLWDGLNSAVLLVYSAAEGQAEGSYLQSRRTGRVVLSALGPLPNDVLDAWLARLAQGPLRRLGARQLRSWLEGLKDGP